MLLKSKLLFLIFAICSAALTVYSFFKYSGYYFEFDRKASAVDRKNFVQNWRAHPYQRDTLLGDLDDLGFRHMTEKEILELCGKPDRKVVMNGPEEVANLFEDPELFGDQNHREYRNWDNVFAETYEYRITPKTALIIVFAAQKNGIDLRVPIASAENPRYVTSGIEAHDFLEVNSN